MRKSDLLKGLLAVAVVMTATGALAGIETSAHDFSGESWSTNKYGDAQICMPCHTPHAAPEHSAALPLWNHAASTNSTYTLYDSDTLTATDLAQPSGVSLACLGCHDGSTAVDSFGGSTGSTTIDSAYQVGEGGTLGNEHPVSFTYDAALATADGGLHNPTNTVSGVTGGGMISDDFLVGGTEMECSSCHDVHAAYESDGLLKLSNADSALCLACHDK